MSNYVWKEGKAVKVGESKEKAKKEKVDNSNKKKENPLEKLELEELLKIATDNGIEVPEQATKETIIELIQKNG